MFYFYDRNHIFTTKRIKLNLIVILIFKKLHFDYQVHEKYYETIEIKFEKIGIFSIHVNLFAHYI